MGLEDRVVEVNDLVVVGSYGIVKVNYGIVEIEN